MADKNIKRENYFVFFIYDCVYSAHIKFSMFVVWSGCDTRLGLRLINVPKISDDCYIFYKAVDYIPSFDYEDCCNDF